MIITEHAGKSPERASLHNPPIVASLRQDDAASRLKENSIKRSTADSVKTRSRTAAIRVPHLVIRLSRNCLLIDWEKRSLSSFFWGIAVEYRGVVTARQTFSSIASKWRLNSFVLQ